MLTAATFLAFARGVGAWLIGPVGRYMLGAGALVAIWLIWLSAHDAKVIARHEAEARARATTIRTKIIRSAREAETESMEAFEANAEKIDTAAGAARAAGSDFDEWLRQLRRIR